MQLNLSMFSLKSRKIGSTSWLLFYIKNKFLFGKIYEIKDENNLWNIIPYKNDRKCEVLKAVLYRIYFIEYV